MIEAEVLGNSVDKEESNAILFHPNNLAVCTILKLLRTIAIDGFRYIIRLLENTNYN